MRTGLLCLSASAVLRETCLPGVTDVVPSYTAVAVHYQPTSQAPALSFASLSRAITELLGRGLPEVSTSTREIEIPVCYGGQHGPDLAQVARTTGLSEAQVIALHCAAGGMVFTLGFAPGLPYIGVHDPVFDIPRRDVPRTAVPKGSVAVANRQTTIYPSLLPGGWHILGATPLHLFDLQCDPPSLLMPGDRVRFVAISPEEFDRLALEQGTAAQTGVNT
jgi:inhibitor of KinA